MCAQKISEWEVISPAELRAPSGLESNGQVQGAASEPGTRSALRSGNYA